MRFLSVILSAVFVSSVSQAYQIVCLPTTQQRWPLNAAITVNPTSLQSAVLEVVRMTPQGQKTREHLEVVMFDFAPDYSWIHDRSQLSIQKQANGSFKGVYSSEYGEQQVLCRYK